MQLNPQTMALTTAKLSELPLRTTLSRPSLLLFRPSATTVRPSSSSVRTSKSRGKPSPPSQRTPPKPPSSSSSSPAAAPWLTKWPPLDKAPAGPARSGGNDRTRGGAGNSGIADGGGGRVSDPIEKIVLRLRNLGLGSDEESDGDVEDEVGMGELSGEEKLGDLLKRDWMRPDAMLVKEEEEEEEEGLLPWERGDGWEEEVDVGGEKKKKRTVKAPSLAELTIEDSELRRLRRMGMVLRERVNVAKAGVTQAVLEKIHDKWRKVELVRLKFHESLAHDMKTAHEIVERRSGGLVLWRSGSVMVVYRGTNYKGPVSRLQDANTGSDKMFIPDVSSTTRNTESGARLNTESTSVAVIQQDDRENMTPEEIEFDSLLDGLGPRFVDWWGTGILPIDADLLPQTIPDFKPPLRLLPVGMRSRVTNEELTDLRKHAKSLPCHFALGRNRHHQGLAAAIIKLWQTTLVVKIAVKRGIQNTNNKLMAEELRNLTGGVLLMRNKFYIVMYRGKDFLSSNVAVALAEREELTKQIQDEEELVRCRAVQAATPSQDGHPLAGTLAEFYEAQARWGREITTEDQENMIKEASRAKSLKAIKRVERKQALAQAKMLRAEKLLSKIESSMIPVGPSDDLETITDEEKFMYRKVGLRMKAYLPVGIRGIFDGVIENMHLHWKHRELVKLITKQKNIAFAEETARLLEYESGGILVAIEPVPKGFALIYYRGKNYQRPVNMRPRNLLTKAKALKRAVALQRHEALCQHIAELEKNIEQMKKEIGDLSTIGDDNTRTFNGAAEFTESEDEEDEDFDEEDEDFDEEDEYLDSEDDDDGFL